MTHKVKTLDKLKVGEKGVVLYLNNNPNFKRRLMDIGLLEGASVECKQESPLGNPVAYLICGAVVALRKEDTKEIAVIIE